MRAGRLRHRLTILAPVEVQGPSGEPAVTWSAVAVVWGAVEPLAGSEQAAGERIAGRQAHRVTIRYRPGLTVRHRIGHGGRIFEVNAIADRDERHAELELDCTEVV